MSDMERKSVESLLQSLRSSVEKKQVERQIEKKENNLPVKEKKEIVISDIIKDLISAKLEEVFEEEVERYFEKNSSEVKKNFSDIIENALENKSQWVELLIKQAIEARLDKIIG